MGLDRILCLANSYKHEHRCVAGISLISKQWVRLVGHQIPGCVTVKEASYADGGEAALLDVFEVELDERCRSNAHPEDVFISGDPWHPVRRFDQPRDAQFLTTYANKGPYLLQSSSDRVYARKFASASAEKSLELIHPEDLWWWIREDTGKRKNRALFRAGQASRVRYDLAVTDPAWLKLMNQLPAGIYPHAHLSGGKPTKTYLTISLSEPFDGFHYKLVAGVVCLPAESGKNQRPPV